MPTTKKGWVSGLSYKDVLRARTLTVQAAVTALHHAPNVHYTQGASRWSGINQDRRSRNGEHPPYADCSAFATWCLWNGLHLPFGVRDTVNGADWKAGYTGTMLSHGRRKALKHARRGDCVIYGRPGSTGAHTAICVGWRKGTLWVISFGSEQGPYLLPYNYRGDVMQIRRYI
jgi:hypothetical protein